MNQPFDAMLAEYDYQFPASQIAQEPASPRDSAKLLVYDRAADSVMYDTFINLGKYVPAKSVLVFNQTKVVPARLMVKKETGGKAEVLYIDTDADLIKVIADRKLLIGSTLFVTSTITFKILKQQEQFYFLKPSFPISDIEKILSKHGQTPLPPYIKHSKLSESERRDKYQTVFSKNGMSVAAPTASLHFTKRLITKLKKQGIDVCFVTLNVNLGTFASLQEHNITSGTLHTESYEIDAKTARYLNAAKVHHRPIIAVGTTVVRTLESAAKDGALTALRGDTNIFIRDNYRFKFVDSIITNFHVPKSSLLMLVSAFMGREKLLGLYKKAVKKGFRLFSFGDGMLVR